MQTVSIDLLNPDEVEAIRALQEFIISRTQESKKRTIEILSRHIAIGYFLGAEKALKQTGSSTMPGSVGIRGLDTVINDLSPVLEDTFGFLAGDLTDVLEEGIRNNFTYAQIKQQLKRKLKSTFGNEIPFQNAGKVREYVKVSPDGKMKLARKTIKRNVTVSMDTYADLLSRTATKKAYALGHIEGYKQAGLSKWRFSSVGDERTRYWHLSLHGKVFEVGSQDESLAISVMGEPFCRCRPIAFFDDPELDTPEEEYGREKKEWAKQALDELGDTNPKQKEYLEKLIGRV